LPGIIDHLAHTELANRAMDEVGPAACCVHARSLRWAEVRPAAARSTSSREHLRHNRARPGTTPVPDRSRRYDAVSDGSLA
jgi:hypothetical protein